MAVVAACSLTACLPSAGSSRDSDSEEDAAGSSGDDNAGSFSSVEQADTEGSGEETAGEREPFDEDAARDAAESELASQQYDGSYGCTVDCSGHEAGWQWRAEHGYAVDGNSNSFSEGGRAYDEALESRVDEMRGNYDSGEEPEY